MEIPGGFYAIGHFGIGVEEYQEAWNFIFGEWLLNSGQEPDDKRCYELMLNDPEQHIDVYIPDNQFRKRDIHRKKTANWQR